MALEQVRLRITGKLPLIMHSNRGVNPREPLAKELKSITGKRAKTDEDLDQMAFIEWQLGLYHDPGIGPYLPAYLLLACLRDAGKRSKQGTLVKEAVWIDEPMVPLEYEGPRDIDGLYADIRYVDTRPVGVMGRTVNRTRPVFPQWAAEFTLTYDAEFINRDDVIHIAETAGRRIGIGDYRPMYGRFIVEVSENGKRGR